MSSCEAEFGGGVTAACESIFFARILKFMGIVVAPTIYLDSSAARGVFQRQGVGRIRHLDAKRLWVQDALRKRLFKLDAVPGLENVADIGTKALDKATHDKHVGKLGLVPNSAMRKEIPSVGAATRSSTASAVLPLLILLTRMAEGKAYEVTARGGSSLVPATVELTVEVDAWQGIYVIMVVAMMVYVWWRWSFQAGGQRSVCTQSQTTYTLKATAPRFKPLSEELSGAWVEIREP